MTNKTAKSRSSWYIYFFGALGGLLFGYDTGVISGALLYIRAEMKLTSLEQGLVVSAVLLGAIIGAAIISPMSDWFGRKKMVMLSALIFLIGALLSGFSPDVIVLVIARVILGVAVGGASALVPMYLAEISPARIRGTLSSLNQLMIMTGILLAYIIDYSFANVTNGWRYMLAFAALPAIILLIGGVLLPESPRFLYKVGRTEDAKNVLMRLRGDNEEEVNDELSVIEKANKQESGTLKDLFSKLVHPALVIAVGLCIFQQITGCNTVLYYAPTIFSQVGLGNSAAILGTVGIGVVSVITTGIAVIIMDKFNRRTLLNFGSVGMAVSLFTLAIVTNFAEKGSGLSAWIVMIALAVYIVFFSATWGPIAWVVMAEVFPLNVRGLGTGFASVIDWFADLIVSLTFPILLTWLGTSIFAIYGIICILAIVFVSKFVFETRGRSLEDIEQELHNRAK